MSSLFKSTLNTRILPIGDTRFIRSDCPYSLSREEIQWLRENHVTIAVDLREEKEYKRKPCLLEREEGFVYYHLPVTGGGDTPESPDAVADSYIRMLDEQMAVIIKTIMDTNENVIYFCTAGKDRTGVVSAIILKKLGFSDQVIMDDYMETKKNLLDFLMCYVMEYPEVDPDTIIPNENNIKKVIEKIPEWSYRCETTRN